MHKRILANPLTSLLFKSALDIKKNFGVARRSFLYREYMKNRTAHLFL